jgi:serine protease inhibitor
MFMTRRVLALMVCAGLLASCAAASPSASAPSAPPSVAPTAEPTATPTIAPSASQVAADIELVMADVARAPASTADAQAAASGINAFGLELLRRLASEDENAVISPASIALALGMARAGARGTTADEMDAVLHDIAAPENAAWLNGLGQALADRDLSITDADGNIHSVTLRIANAPFAQRGMTIQDAYLHALAAEYGAGLRLVDYRQDAEGARRLINGWVDERTEQRIPELLPPDAVNDLTRLVLVNAIYLKAQWKALFAEELTQDGPFTRADGTTVQVPMMSTTNGLPYAEGGGWQAVDLPYVGGALSMTLILPDELASFEVGLDAGQLEAIVSALSPRPVHLTMPRFGIETRASLAQLLPVMGMPTAFNADLADFSGITTDEQLYISDVIHQANIDVDENGTEAAAATAVVMGATSGGPDSEEEPPVEMRLDHPFLFALRDRETGVVLFLGQVVDPSQTP